MAKIPIQSAKFKKDVVAHFAVLLFFVIVFSELFLAVWLPWHLRIDSMWAEQVARRELIEHFDTVRAQARRSAGKLSGAAAAEALLIQKSLDKLTGYLHQYGENLSPEQCRKFMSTLNQMYRNLSKLSDQYAFSAEQPLQEAAFLKSLRGVRE